MPVNTGTASGAPVPPRLGRVAWYNEHRPHGSLDMMTAVEFEQAHYPTLNREPQPV